MSKIIGIDLGTTNCCVAVMEGGKPTVIANREGSRTTPSVVAIKENGERLVGKPAKSLANTNPNQSAFSAMREICTTNKFSIDGKKYCAEQICSMLLREMTETAESYLGQKVSQAVISVPACFDYSQRQAVADAGRIAGLQVLRIISAPTAAAMAYGQGREGNQNILIFDLGGGHSDVSILAIGDGVFEVLSTSGNSRLGGDDFDQRIVDYATDQFKKENGIDLREDKVAARRLKIAAEEAKNELSQCLISYISLPNITVDATGPKHLNVSLTRRVFDELTSDLVDATIEPIYKALKDAGLTIHQINEVILIGSCSQIPAVQKAVKKATGKEPFKGIKADECVAIGAAIHGGVLGGEVKNVMLLDATPISLGLETEGHIFTKLIDKNTTIPTSYSQVFSTATNNQTSIDIHVLQGEWQMAADNKTLCHYKLTGITPAAKGVPLIEVTFAIDNNGILTVSARDKANGKEQQFLITGSSNLSENEITQLIAEETRYAELTKKRRERMETLNHADSLLYEADKTLGTCGDRLTSEDIRIVRAEIAAFKKVRESNDADKIKTAMEGFTQRVYPIFGKLYRKEQEATTIPDDDNTSVPDDGNTDVAIKILPVLDDLERAVEAATTSSDQNLKIGIENILKKMQGIYKDLGFIEINRPGEEFDPNLENAFQTVKMKNREPGTVYRVTQKGYRIGNKVIRHAQVIVVSE